MIFALLLLSTHSFVTVAPWLLSKSNRDVGTYDDRTSQSAAQRLFSRASTFQQLNHGAAFGAAQSSRLRHHGYSDTHSFLDSQLLSFSHAIVIVEIKKLETMILLTTVQILKCTFDVDFKIVLVVITLVLKLLKY